MLHALLCVLSMAIIWTSKIKANEENDKREFSNAIKLHSKITEIFYSSICDSIAIEKCMYNFL